MSHPSGQLGAHISFSPRWWNMIASTRIFVASFCSCTFGDDALSDRVSMATHELLENAVKYSSSLEAPIECQIAFDDQTISVAVTNRAQPGGLSDLQAEFARIKEGDPLTVYLTKMQESLGSDKSQLGLARIQYEGEADLRLTIDHDRVTMLALFDIPSERSNG